MQNTSFYVLLDNIRSKFNVGSIFRTTEFFNFQKIILTGFTPQLPDKEIEKTAIGAEKIVPWQYWQKSEEAVLSLKKEGVCIVVAELDEKSFSLKEFTEIFSKKINISESKYSGVCIVLGNEINGVSEDILKLADYLVEIPKLGKVKESLNVEVSFGIIAASLKMNMNT